MKNLRSDRRAGRTKAPPNGFILFRSDYKAIPGNQVAADGRRKKKTEITKDAATAWKELPKVVRDDYLGRARWNLAEHKREHRDYWAQRRGRNGRFVGVPGSDGAVFAHHGGRPDGTASSLLYPLVQPLPCPESFPGLVGPSYVGPGFVSHDPLHPQYDSVAVTYSYDLRSLLLDVPFGDEAFVNAQAQALPFYHPPARSPNESESFPVHVPSSIDVVTSPPAIATFPHNYISCLDPVIYHLTSVDPTYANPDQGGDVCLNQGTVPLQLPFQPTSDFSSRTLTLSSSDWEMVDLFLRGIDTPSVAL